MCFPLPGLSAKPALGVPREAGSDNILRPHPSIAPAGLPAAGQPEAQQVAVTLHLRGPEKGGAWMGRRETPADVSPGAPSPQRQTQTGHSGPPASQGSGQLGAGGAGLLPPPQLSWTLTENPVRLMDK